MKIRSNSLLYWMFGIFLFSIMIIDFFRLFLGNTSAIVENVRIIIFATLFLFVASRIVLLKQFIKYMGFVGYTIIIIIISAFINYTEVQNIWLDGIVYFFGKSFVGFYFMKEIQDHEAAIKILNKFIPLSIIYAIIYMWDYDAGGYLYNMSMSYSLVLPAILSMFIFIDRKNIIYLSATGAMLTVIMILGSRGPLLCFAVSTGVYMFIIKKYNFKNLVSYTAVVLTMTIIIAGFGDTIINYLLELYPSSRTINMFINNSALSDTGRNPIMQASLNQIIDFPLNMLGIFGDRILLSRALNDETSLGLHPHNLFLELFLQFGVIIACGIIVFLLYLMLVGTRYAYKCMDNGFIKFYCLFFSLGFIQLFFSGSYLINPNFWILIALILSIETKKRQKFFDRKGDSLAKEQPEIVTIAK